MFMGCSYKEKRVYVYYKKRPSLGERDVVFISPSCLPVQVQVKCLVSPPLCQHGRESEESEGGSLRDCLTCGATCLPVSASVCILYMYTEL
jgi:hypothetical protein